MIRRNRCTMVEVTVLGSALACVFLLAPVPVGQATSARAQAPPGDERDKQETRLTNLEDPDYTERYEAALAAKLAFIAQWEAEGRPILDGTDTLTDEPAPAGSVAGVDAGVCSEDFEGNFPGSYWIVGDADSGSGSDYWDDVSCNDNGGSWSAWCADIGNTDCTSYDNNMEAYMCVEARYFGTTGNGRNILKYDRWGSVEDCCDRVRIRVEGFASEPCPGYGEGSPNATAVATVQDTIECGFLNINCPLSCHNGRCWQARQISLPASFDPYSWVRVCFVFESDGSVTDEGAYFDDIDFSCSSDTDIHPIPGGFTGTCVTGVADLALLNMTVSRPSNPAARTFTACSFDIRNNGPDDLSSEGIMVDYYLSNDTTFGDADDRKIGDTGFTVSIASGATYHINLSSTGLNYMVDEWTESLVPKGDYYVYGEVRVSSPPPADNTPGNDYDRTNSTFHYQPDECSNGVCDSGENCSSCPSDCVCPNCQRCVGGTCQPSCGDGTCDPACGENCGNCSDCTCGSCERCVGGTCQPSCGDGTCDPGCGEDCGSCPADCDPICGDGVCECGEDCSTCVQDCSSCTSDPECDDGNPCSTDVCRNGCCEYTLECSVDADCDDPLFCNGAETCGFDGCCLPGTLPCLPAECCSEQEGACGPGPSCTTDADCDEGDRCVDGCCEYIPPADFEYRCVIVDSLSTIDRSNTLPNELSEVAPDSTFFVEFWATDSGAVNTGIVSAYTDLDYPESLVRCEPPPVVTALFPLFPTGVCDGSIVDELGGSQLSAGVGMEPEWARVGYVEFTALQPPSPPCPSSPPLAELVLEPAISESSAHNRGLILPENIDYGACAVEISCGCPCIYDLDNNCTVAGGDLGLFAGCWLLCEGDPGWEGSTCEDKDFDCNGCVAGGDLGWFAGAWLKNCDELDPVVGYPACRQCDGEIVCPWPSGGAAGTRNAVAVAPDSVAAGGVVKLALRIARHQSQRSKLPNLAHPRAGAIKAGEHLYAEVWTRDDSSSSQGLTAVFTDVFYDRSQFEVISVDAGDVFTLFAEPYVSADEGVIRRVGGATMESGFGVEAWVRVAVVEFRALSGMKRPVVTVRPVAGEAASRRGQGLVPNDRIEIVTGDRMIGESPKTKRAPR